MFGELNVFWQYYIWCFLLFTLGVSAKMVDDELDLEGKYKVIAFIGLYIFTIPLMPLWFAIVIYKQIKRLG